VPPPYHGEDILYSRPGRRGDNGDSFGKEGNGTLSFGIEDAGSRESPLSLLKHSEDIAFPGLLHALADDLIGTLFRVDREVPFHKNHLAVLGDEGERCEPVSEHDCLDDGVRVLE